MPEDQIVVQLNPDVPPTGSDLGIVNAARRSFNTRSEWEYEHPHYQQKCLLKDKDKRLLEFLARGMTAADFDGYLQEFDKCVTDGDDEGFERTQRLLWEWRNTPTHDTPFNHTFISFEVKAPIFVRAQLVKHEYLIMSEFSRRYITDDIEFYTPDAWRKAAEDKKQGSSSEAVSVSAIDPDFVNHTSYRVYKEMLEAGVAPEQARMVLPQSTMTEWTWSGTLGAFAKMCTLRCHPEAQYEARLVADQVYKHLCNHFPVAAPLLVRGTY